LNSEEAKEGSPLQPPSHLDKTENSGVELSDPKRAGEDNGAIKRTKRVIVPIDFNEEADLEQAGDAAIREFMLMQQIKLFSPKCHKYEGNLLVRDINTGKCAKAISCFNKN
jgi:hypothetical protein